MGEGVLRFNGERLDPANGHYQLGNGHRAHSPTMMRFISPDHTSPFGGGGLNPYAYCAGDPINRADPAGRHSFWGWLGIGVGMSLGVLLTPISGGTSLAAVLSTVSVISAAASAGLAIAQQFVEASDPHAAAALGWVALGAGSVSGLSSLALTWAAPGARSLIGLLPGSSDRPFGGLMMSGGVRAETIAGQAGSGHVGIWRAIQERIPFLRRRAVFSEGSEAILYKKGNFLIKEYKNQQVDLRQLSNEASIFNRVHATTTAKVKPPRSIKMPLVEGVPLSNNHVLFELTSDHARSLVKSMDRIHDLGILHGDISDGNILFEKAANEFKFIDFSASAMNSSALEMRAESDHLRWKIQQWPNYSEEWLI
ncbi:RHS repeat-associated core domain-containing protein [Chromobacterium violaceum]|uniref:Kinase OspG kinase domain-containing protein n=1 Tax=Chromobacterium violaceum TaxID=536 RepID=A0A202B7P1_CHRVL|nr:RHS repeat-associated core domain-containing protein [Chromobacterium violaceum]OVE47597.1 hypothetical protein CBW21_13090 [Chromobacterium violaceum]